MAACPKKVQYQQANLKSKPEPKANLDGFQNVKKELVGQKNNQRRSIQSLQLTQKKSEEKHPVITTDTEKIRGEASSQYL